MKVEENEPSFCHSSTASKFARSLTHPLPPSLYVLWSHSISTKKKISFQIEAIFVRIFMKFMLFCKYATRIKADNSDLNHIFFASLTHRLASLILSQSICVDLLDACHCVSLMWCLLNERRLLTLNCRIAISVLAWKESANIQ